MRRKGFARGVVIFGTSGFRVKQGSEIAPPRRGGRRESRIIISSEQTLCGLRVSVVNYSSQETLNSVIFSHPRCCVNQPIDSASAFCKCAGSVRRWSDPSIMQSRFGPASAAKSSRPSATGTVSSLSP